MKGSLPLLNSVNNWFWGRVVNATDTSVKSLVAFRIIAGLSILTVYARHYGWIGDIPKAFFLPPILSPANLLSRGFPPTGFFVTLDVIALLAGICITLGIRARISSIIYVIVSIICFNYECSIGKIGHSIFLYLLFICMAYSDWGTQLALVPDKPKGVSPAKSLGLLAVLLCFGYFTAAFEKSQHWINFDMTTAGTARWYYNSYFNMGRGYFFAPLLMHLPFWVWKVMDFTAVFFELSPLLFLLISKKAWRFFLLIAVCFHLINTLFFNISFISNALVYIAFVNYESTFSFFKKAFAQKGVWVIAGAVLLAITIDRVVLIASLTRGQIIMLPAEQAVQLYAVLAIWLTAGVLVATSLLKPSQS